MSSPPFLRGGAWGSLCKVESVVQLWFAGISNLDLGVALGAFPGATLCPGPWAWVDGNRIQSQKACALELAGWYRRLANPKPLQCVIFDGVRGEMTPGEQGGEGPILTKRIWKCSLEEVALD